MGRKWYGLEKEIGGCLYRVSFHFFTDGSILYSNNVDKIEKEMTISSTVSAVRSMLRKNFSFIKY
jgi:hypothetical protein